MEEHKLGWLGAALPDDLRKQITDWCLENVPDFHLGSGRRISIPHITVAYGFKIENKILTELQELLDEFGPISIRLSDKTSLFDGPNEDGSLLKIDVISEDLEELNGLIQELFSLENKHKFSPHITLAYLDPDKAKNYEGLEVPFAGKTARFGSLEFSDSDNNKTRLFLVRPIQVLPVLGEKSINKRKKIAVDFDRTIASNEIGEYEDVFFSVLRSGAKEAIQKLANSGFEIIIWTGNPKIQHIRRWLLERAVPFDSIVSKNIDVDWIIDDRAISSTKMDWGDIANRILAEGDPIEGKKFLKLENQPKQPFDTYEEGRELAEQHRKLFRDRLKIVADGLGKYITHLKSRRSFKEKVVRGKQANGIVDCLRGAVVLDSKEGMTEALKRIHLSFKVHKIDYKIWPSGNILGYYGTAHVEVILPLENNQFLIAEIQLVPKKVWKVKKETYQTYRRIRNDREVRKKYIEEARRLFREANEEN